MTDDEPEFLPVPHPGNEANPDPEGRHVQPKRPDLPPDTFALAIEKAAVEYRSANDTEVRAEIDASSAAWRKAIPGADGKRLTVEQNRSG